MRLKVSLKIPGPLSYYVTAVIPEFEPTDTPVVAAVLKVFRWTSAVARECLQQMSVSVNGGKTPPLDPGVCVRIAAGESLEVEFESDQRYRIRIDTNRGSFWLPPVHGQQP